MADLEIEKVDDGTYAAFLSLNPPGDPYSLLPLLEAYRETFSCDFQLLLAIRNGSPVASCALFTRRRFFQSTVCLMPIRFYDGVQFRVLEDSKYQKQEQERISVYRVFEEYLEKNFAFHQMVFPPDSSDMRAFQWSGARVVPQYTYKIHLDSFSEENYNRSLTRILRSAEDAGLVAGKCDVEELTELHQLSYGRHLRKPPVPSDKLNRLLNSLSKAGLLEIKCARNGEGKLISAMAWLTAYRKSFFFVIGNDVESEKGGSHFLYHEVIRSEKEAGKSSIDFCGANTPTINLYKSAFGPTLEVYFKVWRANNAVTRLASLVKKF